MKSDRRAVWWLSAALLGLAWWVGSSMTPPADAVYVDLAKLSWQATVDKAESDLGPTNEEAWLPVKLDSIPEQIAMPPIDHRVWLRTRFTLPAQLREQDLFVVLGWGYSGVRTLYVNGFKVAESRHTPVLAAIPSEDMLGGVVPRAWLTSGENSLTLRIDYVWAIDTGLTDPRFLFGERVAIERFYLLDWSSSQIFRRGALLLLLGLSLVHAVLTRMTRDPAARRAQWTASAMMLAIALMREASAGELIPVLSPNRHLPATLTLFLGGVAALLSCEFFLNYWQAPRVRLLFRVLNGVGVAVLLATWSLFGHGPLLDVYLIYSASLGVLLPLIWVVGVRELMRSGWPALGTTVLIASIAYIGSASYELVSDALKLDYYPLFSYGVTTCALLTGSVVVAEFLKLGQVNETLNSKLSVSNRELSEALEHSREVDRLKTQFLASVTHELRTPLNVIVNVPEALLEDFAPSEAVTCAACGSRFELEPGESHSAATCDQCGAGPSWETSSGWRFIGDGQRNVDALKLLESSSRHLLAIVDDLLDASRLEAGRMQLTMRRERLADVFAEALSLSNELAHSQGVSVMARERLGDTELVCDRVRLIQVVTNLVVNAVRFAGETRQVELEAGTANQNAYFSVKDGGPGIHPRDQSEIFQIFRQIGDQQHRGAGLGLAIAKRLVELHAGHLSVASELGHGATFKVVLPLEAQPIDRIEAASALA